MKRLIACLLGIMMAFAPLSALAEFVHVVGCEEWVSLREEPSTKSKRLLKVPLRALVTYIEEAGDDFKKVSYNGTTGYIRAEYLTDVDYEIPMAVAHCEEYITLREEASAQSKALAQIPLGSVLTCPENPQEDSQMALVRWEDSGKTLLGFVKREYLSFLPEGECLQSAAMIASPEDGSLYTQTVTDSAELRQLESMIRAAAPSTFGNCPLGAQLLLTFKDGSAYSFIYPTDGCCDLVAENAQVYMLSEENGNSFRKIFAAALDKLRVPDFNE